MNGKLLPAVVLACALGGAALAEEAAPRAISVNGEGRVDSVPDMAVVSLGVTHEAKVARDAMAATSTDVAAVLDRLEAMGIAAKDVQTQTLMLNPVWSDPGSRGSSGVPVIRGYVAANMLLVRVRDLGALGEVLDAVVGDGANQFNGLSFTVQDPEPLAEEARRRAVADAIARARVLAEVHVPLLWPGILTGALMVMVEVMKELPATALLRPLGGDTLAVTVWEATKDSRYDVAALPALLIVAVGLVPVILLVRLLRSDRWGSAAEQIG